MAALCSLLIFGTSMTACKILLVTSKLQSLSLQISPTPILMMSFPFVLGCYFFFSYFFNGGQSYGMRVAKVRTALVDHDFVGSLQEAINSLKTVFTLGFYAQNYQPQDHLYQLLLIQRDLPVEKLRIEEAHASEEALAA